jgi:hypothetical protein
MSCEVGPACVFCAVDAAMSEARVAVQVALFKVARQHDNHATTAEERQKAIWAATDLNQAMDALHKGHR